MARRPGLVAVALMIAALVIPPASAEEPVRHSGTIAALAPQRASLTLEEITTWTGPGSGVVSLTIALTPDSRIWLVERNEIEIWSGSAAAVFEQWPLRRAELRAGDFVTVTTSRHGNRLVAVSVEVVRPAPTP